MKIIHSYPPNIAKIKAVFNLEDKKPIFAWGGIIYNPHAVRVTADLLVHERTHEIQQRECKGKGIIGYLADKFIKDARVKRWWSKYLKDANFRTMQELEAYAYQYKAFCEAFNDKNKRAVFLHRIVSDLSGPMYGNMISYSEATKAIRQGTINIIKR